MLKSPSLTRRHVCLRTTGTLFAPAIARAATRGVSDTEIIIGSMTDLSGVTAVQGVNNANAMRMAFDEANASGGVHGRKIRFIVEDMQYIVPKAVQAMNKLLNRDNIFFAHRQRRHADERRGDADDVREERAERLPADLRALDVRAVQPAEVRPVRLVLRPDARRGEILRRAARARRRSASMYQDTDYGRDVLAGAVAQAEAMGLKLGGTDRRTSRPTPISTAPMAKLRDANCDLIVHGHHRQGHHDHPADRAQDGLECRISAAISPPIPRRWPRRRATRPRGSTRCRRRSTAIPTTRARRCMRSRRQFKKTFGIDVNYLGEAGYTAASFIARGAGEGRPRPDAGQLHRRDGEHEGLARHLRRSAAVAEPDQPSRIQPVLPVGGEGHALGAGHAGAAEFLTAGMLHRAS